MQFGPFSKASKKRKITMSKEFGVHKIRRRHKYIQLYIYVMLNITKKKHKMFDDFKGGNCHRNAKACDFECVLNGKRGIDSVRLYMKALMSREEIFHPFVLSCCARCVQQPFFSSFNYILLLFSQMCYTYKSG